MQSDISLEHIALTQAPTAPPSTPPASTPKAEAIALICACVQVLLPLSSEDEPLPVPEDEPEVLPDESPELEPELPPGLGEELEQAQITSAGASTAPKRITLRIYDAS
jgi:hypothetical protein